MDEINIAALVSYRIYPAKMGGQKGIALFYEYLAKLAPVTMITVKDNALQTSPQNIRVVPLLSNSRLRYINPFYFFNVKKFLRKNNITHLIFEHPYYAWLELLLKWFTKVKVIVHSHNIEASRFKSMGKWWWGIMWHYEKMAHRKTELNFFIQDNDRQFAIEKVKLDPVKCMTVTYGVDGSNAPSPVEKNSATATLRKQYNIDANASILLFNGTLHYKPNRDALDIILEKINPVLLKTQFNYKIIICGNGLPASYHDLFGYLDKNIVFAGFVDDINVFFKGADIFLNPVIDGGGIKTKVVEALGNNLSVVSAENGAMGIPIEITGNKLKIVPNADWENFSNAVLSIDSTAMIPESFFDHFYWGNITSKAYNRLKEL